MVSSNYQIRFFKKPDSEEWHIYREDRPVSLCGEAQLSYNVDSVADILPLDTLAHGACVTVRDKDEPVEAVPAPKAKRARKPRAKAKPKAK